MTSPTTILTTPLPASAHTARPWRIHQIAPDFRLEDVWALATPGGPDDLRVLVEQFASGGDERAFPPAYRALMAIRWKLGAMLRLDADETGLGRRVVSVRERLPEDLRHAAGPDLASVPFHPVYLTDREFVAEIANRTVHALLHLGWVEDGEGGYRGQMAVLTKPHGLLGRGYMAFIKPFRYAVVYPALLRTVARRWQERRGADA